MSKNNKKNNKKNQDKILIGKGLFNSQAAKNTNSKAIKKYRVKQTITQQQVNDKLKSRRMVVPSHKMK